MSPMHIFILFAISAVLPRRVSALPVSYTSAGTAVTFIPLIVISISLFLAVFIILAIKLSYVGQRRFSTIHAVPHGIATTTLDDLHLPSTKQENRYRPILVGFLGSPAWETNLASKLLTRTTWRRGREWPRRAYQLHTSMTPAGSRPQRSSTLGSRLTASSTLCSANQHFPAQWSGSAHRNVCIRFQSRYRDFGELDGMRSPGGADHAQTAGTRRTSPSSIRVVDGPTLSNPVEYSFLSGLPPNAAVSSPLMGTRDSFQLSKCSLRCQRKPAPPLPSLPSGFPFCVSNAPSAGLVQGTEYLPSLRFSPLADVPKVFHSQEQQPSDVDFGVACSASTSSLRDGGSTCVAYETAPLRPKKAYTAESLGSSSTSTLLNEDVPAMPWSSSKEERARPKVSVFESTSQTRVAPKKPLKSCLRNSATSSVMAKCVPV